VQWLTAKGNAAEMEYDYLISLTCLLVHFLPIGSVATVKEAELIGDGLVGASLLVPVVLGLSPASAADSSRAVSFPAVSAHPSWSGARNTNPFLSRHQSADTAADGACRFCGQATYIYTYPGASGSSGLKKNRRVFTLFGDVISVSIPSMVKRMAPAVTSTASLSSSRSDPSLELADVSSEASAPLVPKASASVESGESDASSDTFVEFEIELSNSSEKWTVFRRSVAFIMSFDFII
jgi:hypothetical protein